MNTRVRAKIKVWVRAIFICGAEISTGPWYSSDFRKMCPNQLSHAFMTCSRRSSSISTALIYFFGYIFSEKKLFSNKIRAIFCFSCSLPTLFNKIRVAPNKKSCFHCFRCFRCSQWSPAPSIACFFFFFFCTRHEKPFTVKEKELFQLWAAVMKCWKWTGSAVNLRFLLISLFSQDYALFSLLRKFLKSILKLQTHKTSLETNLKGNTANREGQVARLRNFNIFICGYPFHAS